MWSADQTSLHVVSPYAKAVLAKSRWGDDASDDDDEEEDAAAAAAALAAAAAAAEAAKPESYMDKMVREAIEFKVGRCRLTLGRPHFVSALEVEVRFKHFSSFYIKFCSRPCIKMANLDRDDAAAAAEADGTAEAGGVCYTGT
jgi:hypothetical protein